MLNEQVFHGKWGYGVITEIDGDTVTVNFDSEGDKKLSSSVVFERGILKFKDPDRQAEYFSELEARKKKEAAEKEAAAQKAKEIAQKREQEKEQRRKNRMVSVGTKAAAVFAISDLEIGNVYTNNDLTTAFLVSPQGGMRKSNRTNSLVLVSKHSSDPELNPYEDKWEGKVFHYTGMGLVGDQSLSYSQNKTLNLSDRNGVNVYLFEAYAPNEYTYRGQVQLAGEPYPRHEDDSNGNSRIVYKFPLELIN